MKKSSFIRPSLAWLLAALALPLVGGQTIYTPYHFTTIAGTAGVSGSADGVGAAAQFNHPQALSVDTSGNVYVADTNNQTIRRIVPAIVNGVTAWTVSTYAGTVGVRGTADGQGASAQFTYPAGIYAASDGSVYVAVASAPDEGTYVRVISPAGIVTTETAAVVSPGTGYNSGVSAGGIGDDKPAPGAALDYYLASPSDAAAPDGAEFTIEPGPNNGIVVTSSVDEIANPGAGNNSPLIAILGDGPGSADGPGGTATCDSPEDITFDANNVLYVADTVNDLIRIAVPTTTDITGPWSVTTLAGVAQSAGSSDGTGAAARFYQPYGVAVGSNGVVYVADTGNNTIRMGVPDTGPVSANSTVGTVLGQPVTFTLPATDPFGDPMTFAITGTSGGSASLSGNQATFTPSEVGTGTVTFTASDGYVTSSAGTVTISTIPAYPVISLAAVSQTVATGRSVAFNAQATGYPTPTYQWTLNGSTTIPGAAVTNDSVLLISGTTAADAGTYVCTATNSAGTATTSATLTVATTGTPPRLDNLSARAEDLSGGNILIAGLTIGGSGTEPILLRAVGPGLINAGVDSGLLPNPVLTVFDNQSIPIVSDTGWGNAFTAGSSSDNISPTAATATLMNQVGAFPIDSGSTDSAMEVQMAPGSYTLEATDANGASGVALAEVYDAGSGGALRLTNISARADVGAGGDILIGGLTISGSSAETVLLRAVGPGLVNQHLPNVGLLAQPSLAVYQGPTQIYSNTGWGSDPVIQSVFSVVGATALDSADSAVLVTLPPGSYTVLVSGVGGTSGIGLVEIYEVP